MTFFYLGLAWHAGVGLGAALRLPVLVWLLLGVFGAAGAVLLRDDPRPRLWLAAVMIAGLGAARWETTQPDFADEAFVAHYNDMGQVVLEGVVVDEPDVRDTHSILRVRADTLQSPDGEVMPVRGLVLARAPRFMGVGYGDRVRVAGELQTPPVFEDFNYADYLARTGVYATVRGTDTVRLLPEPEVLCPRNFPPAPGEGALRTFFRCRVFDAGRLVFRFKEQALAAIGHIFPEPQASLLSGILLGVDSSIPESLQQAFRRTGTSHIVAISGFNITIIAGVFLQSLRRLLGERRARPVAIFAVGLYAVLAGADASVVRAAIMGGLVIFANGLGRPTAGLSALMFAAWAMTLWNPGALWDVGFQLSVAATLGLILYADPLTRAAERLAARALNRDTAARVVGLLSEFTILTLAAQLATLPLIAFYFHQISIVSLLANLIVLPVQPQVMILGGLATLVELGREALGVLLPLGQWAAWIAWPFVTFTIRVVELLAQVDWAVLPIGQFPALALAAMYGALFGATWLVGRAPESQPAWWRGLARNTLLTLLLTGMGIGAVVVWSDYFALPDGRLHVTFLDVGHGDAALIQTPGGRYVLLDGGPSPNRLAEQLGRALPVSARQLDLVVALNSRADGLEGLPGLLDRYEIAAALLAVEPSGSSAYRQWVQDLEDREIPFTAAAANAVYDLGDGARMEVFGAPEHPAARLTYRRTSFLFAPGLDADGSAQLALDRALDPATVLLVPDHAGDDSVSALFLTAANPWAAVIAVGAGNERGDPQPFALALLEGRTILRTDERGWIKFATDGVQLWTQTER